MMTRERLVELMRAVEAERDEFVKSANQQAAYLNGKLEMLQALLAEMNGPEEPPVEDGATG